MSFHYTEARHQRLVMGAALQTARLDLPITPELFQIVQGLTRDDEQAVVILMQEVLLTALRDRQVPVDREEAEETPCDC